MKRTMTSICKNWMVNPLKNRHHFEWVSADPREEGGKLTREIGITAQGGTIVRLKRVYTRVGTHFYEEKSGDLWTGKVSVSKDDFRF